jgi:pSer/pThr/pTyr-binding forkhead associated (FHA) protein
MWLACGSQTWELRDGEVVVGSGADADWRVSTADLMPRHFTVTVYGLNASLRPSSMECVVAVNGKQLVGAPHLLNDGDVVAAGSGRFIFSDDVPRIAESSSATAAAACLIAEPSGQSYRLASRSTTIGRDASNTIVLPDARVSRFHAEIRREAGGFALHSMGSAGTLVNGTRIKAPCMLSEGDVVEIAFARLRFSAEEVEQSAVTFPPAVAGQDARRNPTLATGRMAVVEPDRRVSVLGLVVGAAVIAILAIGAWMKWAA